MKTNYEYIKEYTIMATIINVIVVLLLLTFAAQADQCGCTRESDDPVCKAYYELKDFGLDVKVTCKQGDKDGKTQNSGH